MVANLCTEQLHTGVIVLYRTDMLVKRFTMYSQSMLATLSASEAGDMRN